MTTLNELRNRLAPFGYVILRDVKDDFGRRWPYRTAPDGRGGSWGQFKTKAELVEYVEQVERINRMWGHEQ